MRKITLLLSSTLIVGATGRVAHAAPATVGKVVVEEGQHVVLPPSSPSLPPAPSGTLVPMPQPPQPGADQVDQADPALANPINKPVTGAAILDEVTGGDAPPHSKHFRTRAPMTNPATI